MNLLFIQLFMAAENQFQVENFKYSYSSDKEKCFNFDWVSIFNWLFEIYAKDEILFFSRLT